MRTLSQLARAFIADPMKAALAIHSVIFAVLFILFTIVAAIEFLWRLFF